MGAIQNLLKHKFSMYDSGDTFYDDQTDYINRSFYKTRITQNGKSVNDLFREVKPLISHIISKAKIDNYIGFDYVDTYVEVFLKVWNENYREWRELKIIEKVVINNENRHYVLYIVPPATHIKKPFKIRVKAGDCYRPIRKFFDEDEPIPVCPTFKEKTCVTCLDNSSNILFTGCGHICMCNDCNELHPIKTCPICRTKINGKFFL